MLAVMPVPIFKDFSPSHHASTVSSPLSSSPMRASSPPLPLSPRDHNAEAARQVQSSPIPAPKFKFATRPARPNPVLRGRDGFQQTRRDLFLRNVQQRSSDKRWERRGVESKLLSAEWFNMDYARRQAMIRDSDGAITEADIADAERLLEEEERAVRLQQSEQQPEQQRPVDDMMLDALLQEEEAELEALISSSAGPSQPRNPAEPASPHWSDDEDYDALFMDFISGQENQPPVYSGDVEMS